MKKLLGLAVLLVCVGGCFFETSSPRRSHSHCVGCGHIQVKGVWVVQN